MHTPGDWHSCKYSSGDRGIHGPDGRDIALIRDLGEYTEGNTNLFLAAPKLLAALEDLLPDAEKWIEQKVSRMAGSLYPSINAARLRNAKDAIREAKEGA